MDYKEKLEIEKAARLCSETWELIKLLEDDGLPPDNEVFDILAEKLSERIS